jgi:hypothetical protein
VTDEPAAASAAQRGLVVEFDTPEVCPLVFRDDANLVLFFISWAYSIRFGGMHELAQAALHLQRRHKVDLRPLLTFADREVEDPDDQFALDHAWQDAAALALACRATAAALETDDATLHALLEGYEALAARLRDLATLCDWGAARGAPVRLTFTLA